jgi:hypothetical protein
MPATGLYPFSLAVYRKNGRQERWHYARQDAIYEGPPLSFAKYLMIFDTKAYMARRYM